ncbi:hypothetical protein IKS86_03050 [bacterium]|nr:hypothetical protein [bacterium]
MKKSLILIAMLAIATTLFAEDNTISCESDLGKCTYELTSDLFSKDCTCRDGSGIGEAELPSEEGTPESTLPTKEECEAELQDVCGDADILCENEAGDCKMEQNGDYRCWCRGIEGSNTGNGVFSEEGCNAALVEHCGTEPATAKTICTDSEIFEVCLTYAKSFTEACYEPLTDEEMEAALDLPAETNDTTAVLAICCQDEEYRDEFKTSFECLEAVESCENKDCCESCNVFVLEESNEKEDGDEVIAPAPEDGDADAGDTEVPTDGAVDNGDGSAAPTDDADAPTDGAETTGEKEESKSDGCSMLFI